MTFLPIQLPIRTVTFCISTSFSWPWKVPSCHTYIYPECCWYDHISRPQLFYTASFFALHSSTVKPFSVNSSKNYMPSIPKPSVTCPLLPYENPFVAMRLILPLTGSCLGGSLHISLLYSRVHAGSSSQAALMLRGSFWKHLQSNLLIIHFEFSKAIFGLQKFFYQWLSSHVPRLLSIILTKTVLLPPSASPSVCYPLVSHTQLQTLQSKVCHLSAHPLCAESCIWGSCSTTWTTRDFEKLFYYCYYNNFTEGSYNIILFPLHSARHNTLIPATPNHAAAVCTA